MIRVWIESYRAAREAGFTRRQAAAHATDVVRVIFTVRPRR